MFDFTRAWEQIGKLFTIRLSQLVKSQTGIDGQAYSLIKPSTAKKRQAKRQGTKYVKGYKINWKSNSLKSVAIESRGMAVSLKRLYITGEYSNKAFGSKADPLGVNVFVKKEFHSGSKKENKPITYSMITRYNSRGQNAVNPDIKNPPLVFPSKPEEVLLMKDEISRAGKIFNSVLREETKKELQRLRLEKRVIDIG